MIFRMRVWLAILVGVLTLRAGSGQGAASGYLLSPMDKLSVSVSQDPVPGRPTDVSVSPLGDLTIPVSRCCEESITIYVRGKSVEEVEKELKERLEVDFYQVATVQLRVVDPTRRKGQVLLRGAVRGSAVQLDPGRPKTLWEALTEVGVTEYANLRKVKVDRAGQGITEYDIDAVNKGDRTKDMLLQDGDRVTVPEKFLNLR